MALTTTALTRPLPTLFGDRRASLDGHCIPEKL